MIYRKGQLWESHWLILDIVPYGAGKCRLLCVPLGDDNRARDPDDPLEDEQWVIVDASEVDLEPPLTAWERILKDDD